MSAAGKWNLSMDTPLGRQDFTCELRSSGGGWSGHVESAKTGRAALTNIHVEGNSVAFATAIKSLLGSVQASFSGVVEGDTVKGTCRSKFGDMKFTGTRG